MSVPRTSIEPFPAIDEVVRHPLAPAGADVFSAVLTPNRSLTRKGYKALLGVVFAVNLFAAVIFLSVKAPAMVLFSVIGFTAVWLAFELNFQSARQFERIDLCAEHLRIVRVTPAGEVDAWRAHPFWTRLEAEKVDEPGGDLRLVTKGQSISLGAFMAPPERARFADVFARMMLDYRAKS